MKKILYKILANRFLISILATGILWLIFLFIAWSLLPAVEFTWEDPNQDIDGVRIYSTKNRDSWPTDPNQCICEVPKGRQECTVNDAFDGLLFFRANAFVGTEESEGSNIINTKPKKPKKFKCLF